MFPASLGEILWLHSIVHTHALILIEIDVIEQHYVFFAIRQLL